MKERIKVGISACFFHADPARPIFTGKTLQYVEQSVPHWVMSSSEAIAVMIPSPTKVAISPYSMAVAPVSSFRKSSSIVFMTSTPLARRLPPIC